MHHQEDPLPPTATPNTPLHISVGFVAGFVIGIVGLAIIVQVIL